MGEKPVKKRFGPSGSAFSSADALTGWFPGMSPDVAVRYRQRFKVPPIRIPVDDIDAETFKEMLEEQERQVDEMSEYKEETAKEMTKELFFEIYNDPTAKKRKQARSAKQRMIQGLEWFKRQDEDLWIDDQMRILESYLDPHRMHIRKEAYKTWRKVFLNEVLTIAKAIRKKHGATKARAFMEFGYDYAESKEPHDIQPFTKIIRRRVRRLSLRTDMEELRKFSESLYPLLSKTAKEHQPKPKRKRGRPRKKKGALPKGKVPLLDKPEGDKE